MKKSLFTAVALIAATFISSSTYAQDNPLRKGRFVIDADFGLDMDNINETNPNYESDVTLKRSKIAGDYDFGYSLFDNFVLSVGVSVDNAYSEQVVPDFPGFPGSSFTTTDHVLSTTFGLHPRYYFLPNKFKPFVGAQFGYALVKMSESNTSAQTSHDYSGSGLYYGGHVGVSYFVSDRLGFEALFNYRMISTNNTVDGVAGPTTFNMETSTSATSSMVMGGVIIVLN